MKSVSYFALSAFAATWFTGAKGAFAGTDQPASAKPTGVSKKLSGFKQGAKKTTNPWTCYQGNMIDEKNPALFNELMQSEIGRNTASILLDGNPQICTAAKNDYIKKFGSDTAALMDPQTGNLYFRSDADVTPIFVHEVAHYGTRDMFNKVLDKKGLGRNLTSILQAALVNEAGSIAKETIMLYQKQQDGSSDLYSRMLGSKLNRTDVVMVQIMDRLLKEDPALGTALKNKDTPIPAKFFDQLVATSLVESVNKYHLATYTKDMHEFYLRASEGEKDRISFNATRFSEDDARMIAAGPLFTNGEVFPRIAAALNRFGAKLEPFAKNAIMNAKDSAEIGQMVKQFAASMNAPSAPAQTAARIRTTSNTL